MRGLGETITVETLGICKPSLVLELVASSESVNFDATLAEDMQAEHTLLWKRFPSCVPEPAGNAGNTARDQRERRLLV